MVYRSRIFSSSCVVFTIFCRMVSFVFISCTAFLMIFAVLVCSSDFNENRIINGIPADEGEFPYTLAMFGAEANITNIRYFTGAAVLISDQWALTGAFEIGNMIFFNNLSDIMIVAGTNDVRNFTLIPEDQVRGVEEVFIHPDYDQIPNTNDIALVKLDAPLTFSPLIQPAVLPGFQEETPGGSLCVIAGWGLNEWNEAANVLLKLEVPVLSDEDCQLIYEGSIFNISTGMICAGILPDLDKNSCYFDEGGPLECNGTVVGITAQTGLCERVTAYSQVSYYMDWIMDTIANNTFSLY